MKKTISFYKLLFILFIFKTSSAQVQAYYDENLIKIDSLQYANKCYYQINTCYKFVNSDTIVNVIYHKYNFGKLSKEQLIKVKKELKTTIRTNLIIVYKDTIQVRQSIDPYKKYLFQNKKYLSKPMSKARFKRWNKKSSKSYKKCIKKLKDKEYVDNIRFFYNINKRETILKWEKDPNRILKKIFFSKNKNYRFVVIHANGEFFQVNRGLENKKMEKILKAKDWTKFKMELEKAKKNVIINRTNFFKKNWKNKEICF